jgi:transposase
MGTKTFKLSGKPARARIAAGIDVHKYKLQVFMLGRFNEEDKPLGEQVFVNDSRGREEMCCYVAKYYPSEIIMEKTGVLSNPVLESINKFHGWKEAKPRVTVVPPDMLKRFPGEPHTDPRSAYGLALIGIAGLIKRVYVPSREGARLRELTRELEKHTTNSTALINQIKDKLSGLGYTLPKFKLTSAWGLAFIKLLTMDGINGNIEKLYKLVEDGHVILHSASKKAILDRKQKFMGFAHLSISKFEARFIGRKLAAISMTEALKLATIAHIEEHVGEHLLLKEQVRRLAQIPGISTQGAAIIAAEVDDPARFKLSKEFQLYTGRAIAPDWSGEHEGKPRMTKRCNHHLKRVFKQAGSTVATLLKEDSDVRRYAKKQLGKHPRCPAIAIANTSTKIVKIAYKIMHDEVIYDPFHETRKKNAHVSPAPLGEDPSWTPRLKEARRRANRFRNFTRRALEGLPDGEMKDLFYRVIGIFDDMPK